MNRYFKRIVLIWIAVWLIIDILIIVRNHFRGYESDISVITSENLEIYLEKNFTASLKANGLSLQLSGSGNDTYFSYPDGFGKIWLQKQISDEFKGVGAITEFIWKSENSGFDVTLSGADINNYKVRFRKKRNMASGLIAIIVDDFGYFWNVN